MGHKRMIAVCFYLMIAYGVISSILGPLLPSIAQTFNLHLSQTGMIFSVAYVGYMTFAFISGYLSDKYGKKRVLAVNIVGASISSFILSMATNYVFLLILMCFIGGFSGALESLVSAILVDINPKKEAFYVNAAQTFYGVGAVIGPFIVGLLLSIGIIWSTFYLVLSVLFLISFFILIARKNSSEDAYSGVNFRDLKRIFSSNKIKMLCICMLCYSGAEMCSAGWLSTYLTMESGYGAAISSTAVSIFWFTVLVGRLGCLGLLSKYSERTIVIVLSLITAVGIFISVLFSSGVLVWVGIVIMGLGYSAQWPLILAYGVKDWRDFSGTATALLITSCTIGVILFPLLVGLLGDLFGMRIAMGFPSIPIITIAMIFLLVIPKMEPVNNPQ